MSSQEEWDDMNEQAQTEIIVRTRLFAAVAEVDRSMCRGRLERASRSGLASRLAQVPGI